MGTNTWVKAVVVLPVLLAVSLSDGAPQPPAPGPGDWPSFGQDPGAQRYSPLTGITRQNVAGLQQAWVFDTGSRDLQVTPLVIDGLMYLTAGSRVIALAPETGTPVWTFESPGPVSKRGVAYWPGDGKTPARLYSGVREGRMAGARREDRRRGD